MNWYKENKKEWKEILLAISHELKRNPVMVEKDTIQSIFLYELSKLDLPFVFKGGTSLSKAYGLIDRFSEDIDLSMSRLISQSEKKDSKNKIVNIAKEIGLVLKYPENIKSRHDYNKYVFEYESLVNDEKLELIVETSYYQISYPIVKKEIKSFVGIFCEKFNTSLPFKFKALSFEMNTQSLERTFIDKVFAVCDYKIQNMMDRDSRHLYDIAKILPEITLNEDLKLLAKDVRKERLKSINNPSANEKYNINNLLIEIIDTKFYEPDYKNITSKLLYENVSYEEAITNGIEVVSKTNIFEQ